MSNFTFDVFISYSHADAGWVKSWLLKRLEEAGLRACIDSRDFDIGAPSVVNMETAVRESAKILLVLTPAWLRSEWTNFEALLIQTKDPTGTRRRLLPLMLERCELPDRLSIFTYADFTDPANRDSELGRLVKAIRPAANDRPATLQPNLVHPYPLQANFTGRTREREELTAWLAGDGRPVCALVAMGGMGKSALAWYWLTRDVLADATPHLDGVMWWSFYEGESSFARFIDEALRYVGARPIDAEQFPTTYDRAQELRRLLQTRRVLFILDGFERQLRAYAGLDAAYRPDAAADSTRDARSCVDPNASRLLRDIAAGVTGAKVLLTTRLPISDLEDRVGDALAGVLNRELTELPREDAIIFMRAQGVRKGTPAELASACEAYGFHPLSLRLLSGLIARDARTPGDIAAAPRAAARADFIEAQHHILEHSYNALPKRERALLSRIAAFRNPVDYDALSIFNTLGDEARFDAALENLRARGFLQRDKTRSRYDLHPLVRRYAYGRLTDKKRVHSQLRDYFAQIPVPDENSVHSIEDLATTMELYHHTAHAGRYDEAEIFYYNFMRHPLYFRFGAYQTEIELLKVLFPNGEGPLPRLRNKNGQAWVLSALAGSYSLSGQPRNAVRAIELAIELVEEAGAKSNVPIALGNKAIIEIDLGNLKVAQQDFQLSIQLCREIASEFWEAVARAELGKLLSYQGDFKEAAKELDAALNCFVSQGHMQYAGLTWAYRAWLFLLVGSVQRALEALRKARELASSERIERDMIRAEWLVGAALVMEGKDLNAAAAHITEALIRCRRINMVDHEPDILLTWARWHRARGNTQDARVYAEEALAIAERGEYRLKQAAIRNFLARLALEAGDRGVARGHAEVARERAWCDGPPYCYRVALDEAEGLLRELGAGE